MKQILWVLIFVPGISFSQQPTNKSHRDRNTSSDTTYSKDVLPGSVFRRGLSNILFDYSNQVENVFLAFADGKVFYINKRNSMSMIPLERVESVIVNNFGSRNEAYAIVKLRDEQKSNLWLTDSLGIKKIPKQKVLFSNKNTLYKPGINNYIMYVKPGWISGIKVDSENKSLNRPKIIISISDDFLAEAITAMQLKEMKN